MQSAAPALDPLLALATALLPHLRALLVAERGEGDLVDVLNRVPGPRRTIMRAARTGKIRGAVRVGRRWLAPQSGIDDWLRLQGPRLVSSRDGDDVDDLEALRQRLAARRAAR
jgi:hypothetical protein